MGKEVATFDKLFEMKVRYFENTAKFVQKVKFTGGAFDCSVFVAAAFPAFATPENLNGT